MFTVIETQHFKDEQWKNVQYELTSIDAAVALASGCPDTSTVEIVDESGTVIIPLSYPAELQD